MADNIDINITPIVREVTIEVSQAIQGKDGVVQSIIGGTNVTIDNTDVANPIINVDSVSSSNVFKLNIGYMYTNGDDTLWHSGNPLYGYGYYSNISNFGSSADVSPTYDIPSLFVAEENIKITRFMLSGYGYTYPTFTFKLIKYNRNTLSNIGVVMPEQSFILTNNLFETYLDETIGNGLNDITLAKGEVLVMLWKSNINSRQIRDAQIHIEYEKI